MSKIEKALKKAGEDRGKPQLVAAGHGQYGVAVK